MPKKRFTTDGVSRKTGNVERLNGSMIQQGEFDEDRAVASVKSFYDDWDTDATNIQFED
jgi:hypothetical protein